MWAGSDGTWVPPGSVWGVGVRGVSCRGVGPSRKDPVVGTHCGQLKAKLLRKESPIIEDVEKEPHKDIGSRSLSNSCSRTPWTSRRTHIEYERDDRVSLAHVETSYVWVSPPLSSFSFSPCLPFRSPPGGSAGFRQR